MKDAESIERSKERRRDEITMNVRLSREGTKRKKTRVTVCGEGNAENRRRRR